MSFSFLCYFLATSGQSVKREAKVEQKKEGKKISLLFIFLLFLLVYGYKQNKQKKDKTNKFDKTNKGAGEQSSNGTEAFEHNQHAFDDVHLCLEGHLKG